MKPKTVAINFLVLGGLLFTAEIFSSIYYFAKGSRQPAISLIANSIGRRISREKLMSQCGVQRESSVDSESKPIGNELYGTFHRPNALYTVKHTLTKPIPPYPRTYSWSFRTGPYGNRITNPAQEGKLSNDSRKLLVILGDSFLHGSAVNDSGTLGWILQSQLPGYHVFNFARGGTGNVHQTIQLRDAVTENKLIPPEVAQRLAGGVVVLGYADYYMPRNVLAPSRIREVARWRHCSRVTSESTRHSYQLFSVSPKADLDASGRITIIPINNKATARIADSSTDPSVSHQQKVSIALLAESIANIKKLKAKPIIAFINGKDDDRVIAWAKTNKIEVVDFRSTDGVYEHDTLNPYDPHPGYIAHQTWASRLLPKI